MEIHDVTELIERVGRNKGYVVMRECPVILRDDVYTYGRMDVAWFRPAEASPCVVFEIEGSNVQENGGSIQSDLRKFRWAEPAQCFLVLYTHRRGEPLLARGSPLIRMEAILNRVGRTPGLTVLISDHTIEESLNGIAVA